MPTPTRAGAARRPRAVTAEEERGEHRRDAGRDDRQVEHGAVEGAVRRRRELRERGQRGEPGVHGAQS